jgi:hypothetical protein
LPLADKETTFWVDGNYRVQKRNGGSFELEKVRPMRDF